MITRQITQRLSTSILWLLIAAYAAVTVIPDAFPRIFASPFNVPAAVLLSLCFGLIHGAIRYGIGNIAVLLALCLGISNVMENIGVLTGFPFLHYHYIQSSAWPSARTKAEASIALNHAAVS